MAMAAAVPQRPHAAAATETRVRILGKATRYIHRKPRGHPCSVRLHGNLVVLHGSRRVEAVTVRELDHRVEVADATDVAACSDLIHGLLAETPATSEYDLAAKNWVDSTHTPRDIAEAIARYVRDEFDDDDIPALEFEVHLQELRVTLIYTCPICWLDSDTKGQGILTLPCSHLFHTRCIAPWFYRASTCPTCRREIVDPFSYVRSATPEEFTNIVGEDDVLFKDKSKHEVLFDEKCEDEELSDDESEDEPFRHIGAEDDVLFEDESEDDQVSDDKSEDDEELFDDESEDELFMHIGAEDIEDESEDHVLFDEQSEDDEMFDEESEDDPFVDIMT